MLRVPNRVIVPVLALAATIVMSADASGFGCSASAGRLTVLGHATEPVTANGGAPACVAATKTLTGPAAGLTGPAAASALVAATELFPDQNAVLASGGVADLAVRALPTLPIDLPAVAVPDAAKALVANALKATVDLTTVKALIPVLPTNLPTNLVLDLFNPLLNTPLAVVAANAANLATNTANAARNAIRDSIPDSVAFDGSGSLDALLAALLPDGKLPNVELLHVTGAMAYAAGSCQTGTAAVSGTSTVSGIQVLGQSLPAGQVVDRTLGLIDSASIDPSDLAVPAIDLGLTQAQKDLIASIPLDAATAALDARLQAARDAIRSALDGLASIHVLDATTAQVKLTPGQQVKAGDSVTQQALNVLVSIAGQTVISAVIGEAKASAAGVFCDDSGVDPSVPGAPGNVIKVPGIKGPVDTGTPEGATLQCSTRRLVLVDVLERAGRVKLFGVADPALAGKTVSIVLAATHSVVAHARVAKDGSFDTTAPLPSAAVRNTNAARYTAVLGKEESINLKLRRRMVITSTSSRKGYVTIAGRVVGPLGVPRQPITLSRRVSCTKDSVVKVFRPGADGRFRVTVKAPKGLGTAVYRMTTSVRNSPQGHALFKTYTLPRAVDLQR
jgi:hypothetical protein